MNLWQEFVNYSYDVHNNGMFTRDIASPRCHDRSYEGTSMAITKDRGAPAATKKKPPATRKTSLYRLRCGGPPAEEDLASFVLASYLDREDFTSRLVDHHGVRGLLVTGTIAPGGSIPRPCWRAWVHAWRLCRFPRPSHPEKVRLCQAPARRSSRNPLRSD